MPSHTEFQVLTDRRLAEAKALHAAGQFEGAYYLAGYAVEFALKSAVCQRLNLTNVFDSNAEVYKGFKTHRLDQLILISGLTTILANAGAADPNLQVAANSFVLELDKNDKTSIPNWDRWSEQQRYNPATCSPEKSETFIRHVETFVTWLKEHW